MQSIHLARSGAGCAKQAPTTIADQAVVIGRSLRRLGKDPDRLFAHFGFAVSDRPSASIRLSALTMAEVWNRAEEDCGVDFRKCAAESLDMSLYHLLTPLLISSDNVASMIKTLASYSTVISSAAVFRLHHTDDLIGIEIVEDRPRKSPAACDLMRAYILEIAAKICRDPALLVNVDFNCDHNNVDAPLWSAYAQSLRYEQLGNTLWFNRELAEHQNRLALGGGAKLQGFVEAYLAGLTPEVAMTTRVRALLEDADLAADDLSPERVARSLLVSRRTLQRRLTSEGGSLREELHHSRCLRSHRLLTSSTMNFTEIAQAVGCTDAAHFTRSQQAWSGLTPSAYRQSMAD